MALIESVSLLHLVFIYSLLASVSLQTVEGQASYHDIRLVNKTGITNSYKGRLEVLLNGQWGTVCDDAFGITEANVACKQLGFEGAASFDFVDRLTFASVPTPDDPPIMLDEVWCEPTDVSIQDCSHTGVGNHDCFPHEAVGLVCLTNGTLRLTHDIYFGHDGYGQADRPFGRLEVYMLGEWGTVCGTDFDEHEAHIACKSIGFSKSEYHGPFSHFGTSIASESTPIWLEEVRCLNASTLLDCDYNSLGSNSTCSHWDDVGIVCSVEFEEDTTWIAIAITIGLLFSTPLCLTPAVIICCCCGALYYNKKRASQTRAPVVVQPEAQTTAYAVQTQRQLNTLQPPLYSPTSAPYPTQPPLPQVYPPQLSSPQTVQPPQYHQ